MKSISYSAPAKVILSGEHAVVYSKPALVTAIDLRVKFTLFESSKRRKNNYVNEVFKRVCEYLDGKKIKIVNKVYDFTIESQVPEGRGLGWSTALLAAEVSCFLHYLSGKKFESGEINNLAYRIEKIFYKNSSGVDISASSYGGLIYYRKEFEFLKNISSLNFKIPKVIEKNLYLIDSGQPNETTGYMVHNVVGGQYNKSPRLVEEILNDIEKTTKRMVVSIIKEDVDFFIKSIMDNQIFLDMLGVVSKKTKMMLKEIEKYGVGKVTGAGGAKEGSGYILFFTNKANELESYCDKKKINFIKFKQSYEGVKQEL